MFIIHLICHIHAHTHRDINKLNLGVVVLLDLKSFSNGTPITGRVQNIASTCLPYTGGVPQWGNHQGWRFTSGTVVYYSMDLPVWSYPMINFMNHHYPIRTYHYPISLPHFINPWSTITELSSIIDADPSLRYLLGRGAQNPATPGERQNALAARCQLQSNPRIFRRRSGAAKSQGLDFHQWISLIWGKLVDSWLVIYG